MTFLRMTENVTFPVLLSEFRERVAIMRALGVVQWGDIVLGPEPRAPLSGGESIPLSQEEADANDLKDLFYSSGADAGVLMAMAQESRKNG